MIKKIMSFIGLILTTVGCFGCLATLIETILYNMNSSLLPYFIVSVLSMFLGVIILGKYDSITVNEDNIQ